MYGWYRSCRLIQEIQAGTGGVCCYRRYRQVQEVQADTGDKGGYRRYWLLSVVLGFTGDTRLLQEVQAGIGGTASTEAAG
jgi:hypothetical protein